MATTAAENDTTCEAIYFTDPLCSWSWAYEPHLRRLRYEYGSGLRWRYRLGGMLRDWQHFRDSQNEISRPGQFAPQWIQIRELTGMPLEERIWHESPPASSYPACLAVLAAQRQGDLWGERYLRRVREAVMLEACDISQDTVLEQLAAEIADMPADAPFDVPRFSSDRAQPATAEALREDLKECAYREIRRFPTLVLRRSDGRGFVLTGYRPYRALQSALEQFVPSVHPVRRVADLQDYFAHYRRLTACEVAEAFEIPLGSAQTWLAESIASGTLRATQRGHLFCLVD